MISFQLKNIVPEPLVKEGQTPKSEIWGKEVSFKKGKFHLVEAPSGKGKSTFLHLLYGLRKDYQGSLLINGASTENTTPEEWLKWRREELSMVFQDLRLFLELTAWENIVLKNNLTSHIKEDLLKEWANTLGLSQLLSQKVGSLSYGQRQRVAIIRALCQPFSMLLLDEPFSHLDEKNIQKAARLITQQCQQQKAGLILVSLGQDQSFAFSNTKQL